MSTWPAGVPAKSMSVIEFSFLSIMKYVTRHGGSAILCITHISLAILSDRIQKGMVMLLKIKMLT
jgi:hypothetical protein